MAMGMPLMFMLLILNPLNTLLNHPPRDFASLLDPPAVLQAMNVETTDDALIAVLALPDDAAAPDLYVKKLMAIRLLEQNKSAKALPALTAVVKGLDITLGDAALEAISAINGKPSPRPTGASLLKDLARSVPPDAGFVAVLDFERDSKGSTVRGLLDNAMKEMEAKTAANSSVPPEAAAMIPQINAIITSMMPQAEQGLVRALTATGNLRLDAAMLVLPPKLGTQSDESFFCCVAKGLYDPTRIGALLEGTGHFDRRDIAGHVAYADRGGKTEFCLFDANTFLAAKLDPSDKSGVMENLVGALTAPGKAPPQRALAEAFDMVTERHARLAVAGTFSAEQKKSFAATLVENLKPTNLQLEPTAQVAFDGSQALLKAVQAQAYAASLDTQGKLAVHVVCADAAAAAALNESADKLQKTLFDMVTKEAGNVPPPFGMFLGNVAKEGSLWKTGVAGSTVTMNVDNLLMPIMAMTMAARSQARVQPARVQPAPTAPPASK
jgi:hypothetical protein